MERINTILGVKLLLVWIFAASLLGACATAPEPATSTAVGDSGSREVRQLLATAYRSMTKRDEVAAEAALLEARRLDPKNPWIALNLGVINHWRGKNDLARTEYKAALAFERVDNAAVVSDGALNGASVGSLSRHNLPCLTRTKAGKQCRPLPPNGRHRKLEPTARFLRLSLNPNRAIPALNCSHSSARGVQAGLMETSKPISPAIPPVFMATSLIVARGKKTVAGSLPVSAA